MLDWNRYNEVVILTGAGISVASGLGTYRGPGGLWEESGVAHQATARGLAENPWAVWQFFASLQAQINQAKPNAGHLALAELQSRFRGEFTLVTQNVDGLHSAAGSTGVLELQGNINRRRCLSPDCDLPPFEDRSIPEEMPVCPRCGSGLRPDIVLFEELLPPYATHCATRALRTVDLFIAIGTSGTVAPASRFVRSARYAGALTVEINPQPSGEFDREYLGPAEEILPSLVENIKRC